MKFFTAQRVQLIVWFCGMIALALGYVRTAVLLFCASVFVDRFYEERR